MIDWLITWDKKIFLFIHNRMSNSFFDSIMPFIRNKYSWIPLYLIFILLIIYYFRKKSWLVFIATISLVGITDFISSSIFKPFFHRLRPCQNPELFLHIHKTIECGTGFSFISSHAANHFVLAVFLGLIFYEKLKWLFPFLFSWASLICFAQVYVGYHYPADIAVGAFAGIISGIIGTHILKSCLKKSSSHLI